MSKRIATKDGDWYVATESKDWDKAYAKMDEQVQERKERMNSWEFAQRVSGSFGTECEYWEAYRAEKYRIPVEYPMPVGHVIFG